MYIAYLIIFLIPCSAAGLKILIYGATPYYCRLNHPEPAAAAKKIAEMRKRIGDKGMEAAVYSPETLAYPFSFFNSEKEVRARTIDYFDKAMDDALSFGTNRVFKKVDAGY